MNSTLERRDKRAEFMNTDLREMAALAKRRPCTAQKEYAGQERGGYES